MKYFLSSYAGKLSRQPDFIEIIAKSSNFHQYFPSETTESLQSTTKKFFVPENWLKFRYLVEFQIHDPLLIAYAKIFNTLDKY